MSDTSTMGTAAYVTKTSDGVLIEGRPDLFIPEAELQKVDASGADLTAEVAADRAAGEQECQQCGEWFMPRARSGGKPQKYCSEACRREADAERKANATNAPQRESDERGAMTFTPEKFRDACRAISEATIEGVKTAAKAIPAVEPDTKSEIEPLESFSGLIPRQNPIKVASVSSESPCGHDVEISQSDPHGNDPAVITVSSQNVVRLCRMMLWAHGFKTITFAHSTNGMMWSDVTDGDEPGNHY